MLCCRVTGLQGFLASLHAILFCYLALLMTCLQELVWTGTRY
jgi:hypothetical protein